MENSEKDLKRELDCSESSTPHKKPRLSIEELVSGKSKSYSSLSDNDVTNDPNSTMGSDVIDIDSIIDQKIEQAATRNDFTVHNVKRLLREVLTDRDVVQMFRCYLADEQEGENCHQYEPRFTRSLARPKEIEKQQQPRLLDIEFPEEEEDDQDYQPGKEDEDIMKKDLLFDEDSEIIALTSPECALLESGPSTCTTPTDLTATQEDDPPLALRTRSKLPLIDLNVADLEAAFQAPDVPPDLYEVDDEDDEEHKEFVNFLQSLYTGKNDENDDSLLDLNQPMLQTKTDDDDHQDPDFNVMSECETVYKQHFLEDMRNDKSVRVPKWELRELFDDLNDLFASDDEEEATQRCPPLQDDATSSSAPNLHANSSQPAIPSSQSGTDTPKSDPPVPKVFPVKLPHFSACQRRILYRQVSMHVQQLATYCVLYKNNQPTEPLDQFAEAFFGDNNFQGASSGSNALSEIQHKYLHEISLFATESQEFYKRPSIWSVSNLRPALDVVNHYDGLAESCAVEFKRPIIFYKELPLPHCHMALFLCSSAFPYPKLLPRSYNVYNPISSPANIPHMFLPAEDNLLALGFYQFSHRSHLAFMAISRYLLPVRTAQQLILRKTNILRRKNNYREDHPIIKMFTNSGLVSGANFSDMVLDSWIANTPYQEGPIWNRADIWFDVPIDFRAYLLHHCPRVAQQFGLSTEAQPLNVLTKKQKVDKRLPCKHVYYRYSKLVKCSWLNANPLLKENLAARVSGKPQKREVRPKSSISSKKPSSFTVNNSSVPLNSSNLTSYPIVRLSDSSGVNANYVSVPATVFLPADGSTGAPLVITNPGGDAFQMSHFGGSVSNNCIAKSEPLVLNHLINDFVNVSSSSQIQSFSQTVGQTVSTVSETRCSYVVNLTANCEETEEIPQDDKTALNDSLGEGFLAMLSANESSVCKVDHSEPEVTELTFSTSHDMCRVSDNPFERVAIKAEKLDPPPISSVHFDHEDSYPCLPQGDASPLSTVSLDGVIDHEQNSTLADLAREFSCTKTALTKSYSKKDKRIKKTLKMLSRKRHLPYHLESFASKSLRKARQFLYANSQATLRKIKPALLSDAVGGVTADICEITASGSDSQSLGRGELSGGKKKIRVSPSTAWLLSNRLSESEFYDSLMQYILSNQKKKLSGAEILRARRFKTKCHLHNVTNILTDQIFDVNESIDDERDIQQAESFLTRMRQCLIKKMALTGADSSTQRPTGAPQWRSDEKAYEEALAVLCDLAVCVSSGDETALDFSVSQMWRSLAPLLSEELRQDLMSMLTLRQVIHLDLLPDYVRLKLVDHFYQHLKTIVPQKRYWGRLRNLLTKELTNESKIIHHCASHLSHNFYLRSQIITLDSNHTPFSGFEAAIEHDDSLSKQIISPTEKSLSLNSLKRKDQLVFEEDKSLAMPADQSHKRLTCYCPCHEAQRPRIKPKKVDNLGLRHCIKCGLRVYKGIVYMDECNFHLTNVTITWPTVFTPKSNVTKNIDLNKTSSTISKCLASSSQKTSDRVVNKRRNYARRKSFASLQTFLNSPNSGVDPSGLWINLENTTHKPCDATTVKQSSQSNKDKEIEVHPSLSDDVQKPALNKSVFAINEDACFNTDSFKRSEPLQSPQAADADTKPPVKASSTSLAPTDLDKDRTSWSQEEDRVILEHCQQHGYSKRSYEAVAKVLSDSFHYSTDSTDTWLAVRSRIKFLWRTYFESVGQEYYSDEFEEGE